MIGTRRLQQINEKSLELFELVANILRKSIFSNELSV